MFYNKTLVKETEKAEIRDNDANIKMLVIIYCVSQLYIIIEVTHISFNTITTKWEMCRLSKSWFLIQYS